jgi:hypothetical protein
MGAVNACVLEGLFLLSGIVFVVVAENTAT